MGKPVNSDVKRAETTILSTAVNKEIYETFKDYLKEQGYPMNIILEIFMNQYADGKFKIKSEDILKFKNDNAKLVTLNTTVNKEIYTRFKSICSGNGYYVKYVIIAFMEKYSSRNFALELVDIAKKAE